MKRLYEKSKLNFSLLWIGAYVVLYSRADNLSTSIGIRKIITAPLSVIFVLAMTTFIVKNKLGAEYGFCKFKGSYKGVLFFIPIVALLCINLCNTNAWNGSTFEAVLYIVSMLCVGFIEELLFRGFLFKTMCESNVKVAILVSSLTFGLGHVFNLLNGKELISTLLQMGYATVLGFMLTILFYKGKSILPCILFHSLFNVLSLFHGTETRTQLLISSIALCVISAGYALWIWKMADKFASSRKKEHK